MSEPAKRSRLSSRSAYSPSTAGLRAIVIWLSVLLLGALTGGTAIAAGSFIQPGEVLPSLTIRAGGQVVLEEDDYRTAPWSGPVSLPMVQVFQYVPGTRKGGSLYDALTERMQRELDPQQFRITAIVNLDASSVFIKPFVRAEVVSKQRTFQLATMVLDEDGTGRTAWRLEKESAFIVTDETGRVVDAIFGPPSQEDLDRIFAVLAERLLSPK
jgi:predicted transcriptional regulator